MQIKTSMRYHLTSIRMAIIKKKKTEIISIAENVEKREPPYAVGENVNWCNHYGN